MSNISKKTIASVVAFSLVAATGFSAYAATQQDKTIAPHTVTSSQAIATAISKVGGGQASELELKRKNGASLYKIEVINNNQKHKVTVDANSGQVLNTSIENDNDADKAKAMVSVTLTQAIATAESSSGGITKEADLKTENNKVFYEIETLNKQQKQEVRIDANTGKVL